MDTVPMTEFGIHVRQLQSIGRAVVELQDPTVRGIRTLGTFVAGAVLAAIAQQWFVPGESLMGNGWLDATANVIAGLLAAAVAYKLSPDPSEALERLDQLLAAYEPVDVRAYAELQTAVRERRGIEPQRVIQWMQSERTAIRRAQGIDMPSDSKFLARSVVAVAPTTAQTGQEQGAGA